MSDKNTSGVQFDSDDAAEQELWSALADIPRQSPSMDMRGSFYRQLEAATTLRWTARIRGWLGLGDKRSWFTAAACLLAGIVVGQFQAGPASGESPRLAALEESVAILNRQLVLDRMQDATPGQRLRAVIDAESMLQDDVEITRALLVRATQDRVQSVRSTAIAVLGTRLNSTGVDNELMAMLQNSDSPLVQLALVDLVLRNGDATQLQFLLELANSETLHPDLIEHVRKSLVTEPVEEESV